jgi:hypothetical protein
MKVVCDIDGVIADAREYIKEYLPHDWLNFYAHTCEFPVIKSNMLLICALARSKHEIFFVTGRDESNRLETEKWLNVNFPYYYKLLMRSKNDPRINSDIKLSYYANIKPDIIIDDEPAVIKKAIKSGYNIIQVHGYRVVTKLWNNKKDITYR